MNIRVFSRAKINLTLNVFDNVGGYHNIRSIVSSISLGDYVNLAKRNDNKINIEFYSGKNNITNIIGENNSVKKTVGKLDALGLINCGLDIIVEKNVPIAGGLGGSSVDTAATLLALDKAFDLSAKNINLLQLAAELGSDTPFMLEGGTAIISGRGEIITKIENNLKLNIVIACKNVNEQNCTSKNVYTKFDELKNEPLTDNNSLIAKMLKEGDENAVKLFYNQLTESAICFDSGIEQTVTRLKSLGAINAVMTGSGNCVAGYFANSNLAQNAADILAQQGYFAHFTHA